MLGPIVVGYVSVTIDSALLEHWGHGGPSRGLSGYGATGVCLPISIRYTTRHKN
jgi:hypothetical protein